MKIFVKKLKVLLLLSFLLLSGNALSCSWESDIQYETNWRSKTMAFGYSGYEDCDQLNLDEKEAIHLHVYGLVHDVNNYLRGSTPLRSFSAERRKSIKKQIKNIDSAFLDMPLLPNVILYRGIDLRFRKNQPYSLNEEFSDQGYLSTSVSYDVGSRFMTKNKFSDSDPISGQLFVIYNNYKTHGILVGPWEKEVILPRNIVLKVMDTVRKNNLYYSLVQRCVEKCSSYVDDKISLQWNDLLTNLIKPEIVNSAPGF